MSGGEAFFRVDGRYPVAYSGDRPIQPGDRVRVRFYGPEGDLIVAESPEATATVAGGLAETIPEPTCS